LEYVDSNLKERTARLSVISNILLVVLKLGFWCKNKTMIESYHKLEN